MKINKILHYKKWLFISLIFILIPFTLPLGYVSLITEIMILAIAACGYNLLMGYAGMVSFGPAGQYALGAYVTGILLVKTSTPFLIAFIAGPIFAGLASVIIGWFCVRRTEVYFSLLTLAFAQIIYTIIQKWYSFTGGDDGLVGIVVPNWCAGIQKYYIFTMIIAFFGLLSLWKITNSPFGKILQGIRENSRRIEFISINVKRYQLFAFVISAFYLGVAGSLYACFNGSIFPANIDVVKSTDIIVVCLLGGMYKFWGPVFGSFIYLLLNKIIANYTEYWALTLGIIIIFLVIYMRGGIGEVIGKINLLRGNFNLK